MKEFKKKSRNTEKQDIFFNIQSKIKVEMSENISLHHFNHGQKNSYKMPENSIYISKSLIMR